MQSLIKKKSSNYNNPENLSKIHIKAMKTLEVLTKNMIAGEIPLERIFEFYHEAKRENVIKLLLRSRKMYEARGDVRNILLCLVNKDVSLLNSINTFHRI
jgi:hypothetical protein